MTGNEMFAALGGCVIGVLSVFIWAMFWPLKGNHSVQFCNCGEVLDRNGECPLEKENR